MNTMLSKILGTISNGLSAISSSMIMDRQGLKQYAREQGQLFHYGSGTVYSFKPPTYPNQILPSLERRLGEYQLPVPFVAEIPSVDLIGPYPFPIIENKIAIEPICRERNIPLNLYYSFKNPDIMQRSSGNKSLEYACLLFNSQSRGFYHWTIEDLTRLEGVLHYEKMTNKRPTLILPPDPLPFQVETIQQLGFSENDWVEWDTWHGTVEHLVVPSVRRNYSDGLISPTQTEWLRTEMLNNNESDAEDRFSDRIYLTRNDADRRRVINEEEIINRLKRYGFERYSLLELSERDVIKLFSGADIIVGPHGANLTGIMYSNDAIVVELRPDDTYSWAFYVLSQQHGIDYRYVMGETKKARSDFTVNVNELLSALPDHIF